MCLLRGMARSRFWCALAYLAALAVAVAVAVGLSMSGSDPLRIALAADVAATLVVFAFSVALDNSSLYDPYWSVAPFPIGLYFALHSRRAFVLNNPRAVLVLALVAVWGVRLTHNFLRGWQGLEHEDWRYVDMRQKTGRAYWLVSLLGIHLFPTLIVFAGCLPMYVVMAPDMRPLHWLDAIACAVTAIAIAIEAIADAQLRRFKLRVDRRPGEVFERGLWAWSRHPNYFGEMLFWWGLWLFAVAAGPGHAWTVAGAIAITLLFHLVSIRLLETRMRDRPGYAERIRTVPAFVPYRRPDKARGG
jgi:steroid 5-alpha reductase family enzyme